MSQLAALLLSFGVEAAIAAVVVAALRWGRPWRAAIAAVLGTLLTHPIVWPTMLELMAVTNYWLALLLVESCVAAAETFAYRLIGGLGWRRALIVSIVANATSTGVGLLIYAVRSL